MASPCLTELDRYKVKVKPVFSLISPYMESPNFWHFISQLGTVLYRNHMVLGRQRSAALEIPNHWISPNLFQSRDDTKYSIFIVAKAVHIESFQRSLCITDQFAYQTFKTQNSLKWTFGVIILCIGRPLLPKNHCIFHDKCILWIYLCFKWNHFQTVSDIVIDILINFYLQSKLCEKSFCLLVS